MATTGSVTGDKAVIANLKKLAQECPESVARAMYTNAEFLMTESKKEVPVDTGTARSSGFVDEPKITSSSISVTLGYGGPASKVNPKGGTAADYIEILHEDTQAHHTTGKAKFLEDPVRRNAKTFFNDVLKSVRDEIRRRGV